MREQMLRTCPALIAKVLWFHLPTEISLICSSCSLKVPFPLMAGIEKYHAQILIITCKHLDNEFSFALSIKIYRQFNL